MCYTITRQYVPFFFIEHVLEFQNIYKQVFLILIVFYLARTRMVLLGFVICTCKLKHMVANKKYPESTMY